MKQRLADYVADFLAARGVTDVFSVVGGGAMHLNDALGHNPRLHVTYNHHEQACAIAAEAYARLENKIAAVCVTTGPGGTNALTGVVGGWLDSIPMFIVSGQVRYDTTARYALQYTGTPLRAMGDQEYDITKFGIAFAGAQKNIGPAGVTIVIIRDDLLGHALDITPTMLDYKVMADKGSMYNTPNTWGIYLAGLTFDWLLSIGGVEAIYQVNQEKAKLLYDFLDNSKLFKATAQKKYRSLMNVTFVTGDAEKDAAFVKAAAAQGLVNLKGHRTVGGMRASIYNAMPMEGVKKLVEFMKKFERENV